MSRRCVRSAPAPRDQPAQRRGPRGHRRTLAGILAFTLAAAACSVTTPRNEEVAVGGRRAPGGAPRSTGGLVSEQGETGGDGGTGRSTPGGAAVPERSGAAAGGPTPTSVQASPGADGAQAPGQTTEVGVADDSISITVIGPWSGVYGVIANEIYRGVQTWQDDVNSNGGIHGRKVVLKRVDDLSTPEGGVAACKEALSNGTFTTLVVAGVYTTSIDCLDEAIPNLYGIGSDRQSAGWTQSFAIQPSWDATGRAVPSLVRKMGDGSLPVGVLYINDGTLADAGKAMAAQFSADRMNLVAVETAEPNQASYVPQLIRLRNAGAQVVAVSAVLESVSILRDARSIGYQAKWYGSGGMSIDAVTTVGRDLFRGVHGVRGFATIDSAAYAAFEEKARKYGRTGNFPAETLGIYGYAVVLGRVLEAAGPQPTRASLLQGMESIRDFDTGIFPSITWGPDRRVGTDASFPVTCCDESNWSWLGAGPPQSRFA